MGSKAKELEIRLCGVQQELFEVCREINKEYTRKDLHAFSPMLVRMEALACELTYVQDWMRELLPPHP